MFGVSFFNNTEDPRTQDLLSEIQKTQVGDAFILFLQDLDIPYESLYK